MTSVRFPAILITLFLWPILAASGQAQENEAAIRILVTFNYPNTFGFISAEGMNDKGDVVGEYLDPASDLVRGFIRFRTGRFSQPIVNPGSPGSATQASDINNSRTVCGFYYTDPVAIHGFFFEGGAFSTFDIEGAVSTVVTGLNSTGDFVGHFDDSTGTSTAFLAVGEDVTPFSIPGASFTGASDVNESREIAGTYRIGSETVNHGYIRNARRRLIYPLDFPASTNTVFGGINDRGWVVGSYFDAGTVRHGLVFKRPNTFLSYTYPGASYTALHSINKQGLVVGDCIVMGLRHAFIGRLQ